MEGVSEMYCEAVDDEEAEDEEENQQFDNQAILAKFYHYKETMKTSNY